MGATDVAVLRNGREQRIPVEALAVGDRFVVRPGEKIATDGAVIEGSSAVDARLLTREPVPVEVGPGGPVTGVTVNAGGGLLVRATRVGAATALARMARLVEQARSGEGAGAAAGRPGDRGVRAGRDRAGGRDSRVLAGAPARVDAARVALRVQGLDHYETAPAVLVVRDGVISRRRW